MGGLGYNYLEELEVRSLVFPTGTRTKGGYSFTHVIEPEAILSDLDRPDLEGSNESEPPNVNPESEGVIGVGIDLSNGVDKKWDGSRRIRAKLINPNNINFEQHDPQKFGTFPNYPDESIVGNDDAQNDDPEDNDPYTAPNQNKLTVTDEPTITPFHSEGEVGDSFELKLQFEEFVRIEIAEKWYLISDPVNWKLHASFRKISESDPNGDGDSGDALDLNSNGNTNDEIWVSDEQTLELNNADF